MNTLIPVIIDGLFLGISLAVLSAGLAIVVNVIKIINLSHGAFFLLGCYLAYTASHQIHHAALIFPVAFFGPALIGLFISKAIVSPLRKDSFAVSVSTLAVAILFEQVAQILWGDRALSVHPGNPLTHIGGTGIYRWHVNELIFIVLIALLFFLLSRTKLGLSMKITAEDEEMAKSVGVDTEMTRGIAFALACGLSSLAGLLTAPAVTISPTSGRMPLIVSLIVVILSGHERLLPVLLTGTGVGIISNLLAHLLPSYASYTGLLLVTVLLLLAKPSGLFGFDLERDY